jgi:type II secretory pathway pseudopilin PulG
MRLKQKDRRGAGFSLLELLLVAGLGAVLCGVALQLLLGEARQGGALAERLILRRLQRRTLQLIKGDLADAKRWQLHPDPQPDWPCPMAHRDVLIAIHPAHGSAPVLYSLGSAPSGIWRGQVLMRCGPAFDLQGRSRASSTYQNRVVLDAIETIKLHQPLGLPVIEMELEQLLNGGSNNNRPKPVRSTAVG